METIWILWNDVWTKTIGQDETRAADGKRGGIRARLAHALGVYLSYFEADVI